jgi:hypothetical protein
MPCMVSETGLRLMPNRKDWQPEDTQLTSSPRLKPGEDVNRDKRPPSVRQLSEKAADEEEKRIKESLKGQDN